MILPIILLALSVQTREPQPTPSVSTGSAVAERQQVRPQPPPVHPPHPRPSPPVVYRTPHMWYYNPYMYPYYSWYPQSYWDVVVETPEQRLDREIRGIYLELFKENGKKKPNFSKIEKLNRKLTLKIYERELYNSVR